MGGVRSYISSGLVMGFMGLVERRDLGGSRVL